jgi:hypothetical protein
MPDNANISLPTLLEDIACGLQIQAGFSLVHPPHAPLELEASLLSSLQQLPTTIQDQYFRWRLGSYLASIYDSSDALRPLHDETDVISLPIQANPVQNTTSGFGSPFYKRLHASNSGQGYFDPGWLILRQAPDGLLAVEKNGLTLHISPERHLRSGKEPLNFGERISIRLPSNHLEQGYYVAVGNAGSVETSASNPVVNLYFNLDPEGIIALMADLTVTLNAVDISFTFKAPHNESHYEHCDTGILSLAKNQYVEVRSKLETLYQTHRERFRSSVPLFTKCLAPGLALAEQPLQPITPQENFSMHRFQILAEGLVQAWRRNVNTAAGYQQSMLDSLATHGVNIHSPYLNPDTLDCYQFVVDEGKAQVNDIMQRLETIPSTLGNRD